MTEIEEHVGDIRDAPPDVLAGKDAVIHLAGLSTDPLGYYDLALTGAINHHGSVRLARMAKRLGVPRVWRRRRGFPRRKRHGEVLLKSDGSPWRPIVHVEDIAAAYTAALEAPRNAVHGIAFNVGMTTENYQILEIAEIVRHVVPGSWIVFAPDAGPDPRCYRVDCDRITRTLHGFKP